jgi:MarR family transcriptional regulator, transcriptional regulator for hemolysin
LCIYIQGRWHATGRNETGCVLEAGTPVQPLARGFARLSEIRLKPLGFGVGRLPVLIALRDGLANTQRYLARFARMQQPPMAQMLARSDRDGLIQRTSDPADALRRVALIERAEARMPEAITILLQGNPMHQLRGHGTTRQPACRLVMNLDRRVGEEMTPLAPAS